MIKAPSNRLPVSLEIRKTGQIEVSSSPGGLVTALAPMMNERGGLWIGWPGTFERLDFQEVLNTASDNLGYKLKAVSLTEEELKKYYFGFSNEIIWPNTTALIGKFHLTRLLTMGIWLSYTPAQNNLLS